MAEIVTANVSIGDSRVVGATFNVPMLLAPHFAWEDRYRDYSDIDGVGDDFATTDPIYVGAAQAFAQESKEGTSLALLRIGRQRIGTIGSLVSSTLATPSLVSTITVTEVKVGWFYVLKIGATAYGTLATAGQTVAQLATAWALVIDGAADYTATAAAGVITVTKTTAGAFSYAAWAKETDNNGELTPDSLFTVGGTATYSTEFLSESERVFAFTGIAAAEDEIDVVARLAAIVAAQTELSGWVTFDDDLDGSYNATGATSRDFFRINVDARQTLETGYSLARAALASAWHDEAGDVTDTIADALSDITDVDPDWYGLVTLDQNQSVQEASATAIESLTKLYIASSQNPLVYDAADETDIAFVEKGLTRHRTMVFYADDGSQFADLAMFANRLPNFPGASTFAGHELLGVNKIRLTTTQEGAVFGKNANLHVNLGGQGATQFGTAASGRFLDLMWLKDYVESDLATTLTRIILAVPKIPMTDAGLQTLVDGATNRANFYLANDLFAPFVSGGKTVPYVLDVMKAEDIPTEDRNNRHLPSGWLTLTMRFAGAVHTMVINVTGTI